MTRYFLGLFSMGTLVACSPQSSSLIIEIQNQTAIIGGNTVYQDDVVAKSTVALMSQDSAGNPYVFCTGILISKNLILSAAHCLSAGRYIYVHFGVDLPVKKGEAKEYAINAFSRHSLYGNYGPDADLALARLDEPAPDWAIPAVLLKETSSTQVGDVLTLAGYGYMDDVKKIDSTSLRKVDVPVAQVINDMIVTDQTSSRGACAGDSGGPAFLATSHGLVVVGLTRGAHKGVSDCHHYGEYTAIKDYKAFIVDTARVWGADRPVFVDRN